MQPTHVISFAWHPMRPPTRYAYAAGAALAAGFVLFMGVHDGEWLLLIVGTLFAGVALGFATDQQTHIDPVAGVVTREGRLFDRLPIWRARRLIVEYEAVAFQRTHDAEGGDSVFVGLRPKLGRFVAVRYFATSSGGRCDAAVDFACLLARSTSLKVIPETRD